MSDDNLFYDPDKSGLEIFEQINDDHADYSFDDFVIWKRKSDGVLLYASDSGCSCPAPFEDTRIGDLTPVTDMQQLEIAIDEYRGSNPEYQCCTADRKQEVLRKVKDYLKGARK